MSVANLKITFNTNRLRLYLSYITLVLAFMEASLRITESGLTVIYRWMAPLTIIILARNGYKDFIKITKWFFCFCLYSVFVSLVFFNHVEYVSYLFIFFMLCEFFFVEYIAKRSNNFNESFFYFLDIFTIIIFVLGFLQYHLNFVFPNIQIRQQGVIYLFFWNENELAAAISFMGVIYCYRALYKKELFSLFKFLIVFIIDYLNDAKLSLLGLVLGAIYLFISFLMGRFSKRTIIIVLFKFFAFLLFFMLMTYLIHTGVEFQFRDYKIDFSRLIGSSIRSILTLSPQDGLGSIQVRTNAIIYGLTELKNSFLFGIGLDNSNYMLTFSKYYLVTAKSMHNFIFKCITELGYFSFFVIYSILKKFYREDKVYKSNDFTVLRWAFLLSFIFISSQSSAGILSNYMLWSVVYYVLLLKPVSLNNREMKG